MDNFDNLVDQAYQDREPIKDRGNNSNLKRIEKIEKELCPLCGGVLVKKQGCIQCSDPNCVYEKCAI